MKLGLKHILFFIFILSQDLWAQTPIASITQNNLLGISNSNGLLFDSLSNVGLTIKRNNALFSLINSSGLWLSGKDSLGNLHIAAHNVLGNNHDFWAGPLETKSGQSANPNLWNKVYPISKTEIQNHQKNYRNSGYTPSSNILNWPGSSSLPYSKTLAPFVDIELNNQLYEPLNGDYPYITSDALIYSIFNDNYAKHSYSNSISLGVEVHSSLYAFNSNDKYLQNSLLARFVVYNRSGKSYDNFRLSNVINFKIGNQTNEFLGTDVKNNTLYAINDTKEATFQNKLLSIGCMIFNRPLHSTMYFLNENNSINGQPVNDTDFYKLMQGNWKNGKKLSYGSDGVDGIGTANFIYPNISDNSHSNLLWTEESSGNTSGQRIGILNTGATKFKNGQFQVFDFIYFFVDENTSDIKQIDSFCINLKNALKVKNLLKNNKNFTNNKDAIDIYPNPVNTSSILTIQRDSEIDCSIEIFDMTGKSVFKKYLAENDKNITLPPNLVNGIFFLNIKTLNTITTKKLTIH